jgi:glycosyltransferase involved in cell wall biosynthesis
MQDGHVPQFAAALQARGVPAIAYFHGLDFEDWTVRGRSATAADLPAAPLFANSEYTARRFNRKYGITVPVIPPVFRPELYRTARRGKNVVFINPVPEKGVDLALEIAASCPEIPFVFVKGWPIGLRDYLRLTHRISRLQNVRLVERRDDMREIFRECLMLLVPSKWQRETWGRVASEAHFSGIPVIGTKVGGLPEAIGPGGVVIEPGQAAATWVAAVRRLYHDEEFYQEKSRAALLYSQRPELQMHRQVTTLLAGLNQAISLHQSQTAQASWPRVRTA